MKNKINFRLLILACIGIYFSVAPLMGESLFQNYQSRSQRKPTEAYRYKGVEGYVSLGESVYRTKTSLENDPKKEKISSYDEEATQYDGVALAVDFQVAFNINDWRFSVDDNGFGTTLNTRFGSFSSYYNGSFDYASNPLSQKIEVVYEDPYLLNKKREETKEKFDSLVFSYEKATDLYSFETGVEIIWNDYQKDRTTKYNNLGRKSQTNMAYVVGRYKYFSLGILGFSKQAKGAADSAKGSEGFLNVMIPVYRKIVVHTGGTYGDKNHNAPHPVFNRKRKDAIMTAYADVKIPIHDKWSCSISYLYDRLDSNINFFDTNEESLTVTANYMFYRMF